MDVFNVKLVPDLNENECNAFYIHIAVFEDVVNVKEIGENKDINICLINAALILDVKQVLVAANKAVYNLTQNKMKTRSIHAELLFNLSPSKNITSALNVFGNASASKAYVAVIIDSNVNPTHNPFEKLQGVHISIDKIGDYSDLQRITDVYDLKICSKNTEAMLDLILSKIASKDLI